MRASPYGQYCPIAQALDVLGERWTLLILRELAHAPARFSDIQTANPGLSPTLLTKRLAELTEAGLVTRRWLPPPGRTAVYELTDVGREAVPVLHALGRFGSRLLPEADAPAEQLLRQFELFRPAVMGKHPSVDESFILRLNGKPFGIHVGPSRFDASTELPESPAADISIAMRTMAILANGGMSVAEAEASGDFVISGDRDAALRLLRYLSLYDHAA